MVVIWNPTVRKSVAIVIPSSKAGYTVVGFGVCPDTSVPKLVKIIIDHISSMWVVEVFTLSTRVWKTVFTGAPFKSRYLSSVDQVFLNGVIYFHAYDDINLDWGDGSNFIISFDLKSEKFGEVCLPERLVHTRDLNVTKVNESLGLLEYYYEGDKKSCGLWTRKDGANNPFTKIYTIKVERKWLYRRVLGFRNNGEVVMELQDDNHGESRIEVYEPLSRHISDVGINGNHYTFFAKCRDQAAGGSLVGIAGRIWNDCCSRTSWQSQRFYTSVLCQSIPFRSFSRHSICCPHSADPFQLTTNQLTPFPVPRCCDATRCISLEILTRSAKEFISSLARSQGYLETSSGTVLQFNIVASLRNKFGEYYFIFKFGISGLPSPSGHSNSDRIPSCMKEGLIKGQMQTQRVRLIRVKHWLSDLVDTEKHEEDQQCKMTATGLRVDTYADDELISGPFFSR
ncbi:ribonuclease H-like domain-containing protein [Tanacetum coccineum]